MTVTTGDCLTVMAAMEPASVDAVVCDPPYGLAFMGKEWDHGIPGVPFWAEAYRVAKPGAPLVAFGGTRTHHRLMVAIEDAGWEIRDCLMWLYGSGFPKSHNGAWGGTALKPAWEPIILARKPLAGTVAANVERYGTGGLNIDGCRIGHGPEVDLSEVLNQRSEPRGGWRMAAAKHGVSVPMYKPAGRWPANVVLDEAAAAQLGDPSRFFFVAKASRSEREAGLTGFPRVAAGVHDDDGHREPGERKNNHTAPRPTSNHHPTVKPIALMCWLCRLVTPPGGLILDPFTGSGSTGCAAVLEGFRFHGIELSEEYTAIAQQRISHYRMMTTAQLALEFDLEALCP